VKLSAEDYYLFYADGKAYPRLLQIGVKH